MGEVIAWGALGFWLWMAGFVAGWFATRRAVRRAERDARIAWRVVGELTDGREQRSKRKREVLRFDLKVPVMRIRVAPVWETQVVLQ